MEKTTENKNKELLAEIEKLKRQVKILKSRRKYGLTWEEEKEPEQIVLDCQYKIPILKEMKTKAIITDKEMPENILIEGDNYHALSVLNYTHKGKIDVIYIDPPYNTGNKSWKYNNDYVDKDDNYKHSKWLNMMNSRLLLAKNLLKDDGCLICAIDENEYANLYLLLEQTFLNYNIDVITVVHNPRGVQGKNFSYNHEYAVFVYPDVKGKYIEDAKRNTILQRNFRVDGGNSPRNTSKTCFYPILIKENKVFGFGAVAKDDFHPKKQTIELKNGVSAVWPIDINKIERKWSFSRNTVEEIMNDLIVKKSRNGFEIYRLKEMAPYRTVWIGSKYDANEYGSKLVSRIVGKEFPFPKSLYTVKECLAAVAMHKKNAIVLDYFAGSGTTGHAVLEMNKEDGGNRKFVLCTNNESNICTDITYPRIKNVIEGYNFNGNEKSELYKNELTPVKIEELSEIKKEIEEIKEKERDNFDRIEAKIEESVISLFGIKEIKDKKVGLGGNLQYFKTELLDIDHISHVSDEQKIRLTYQAGEMIALREDTFDEVEKDEWWQIFENGQKYTAIYFKEDKSKLNELVNKLSKLKKEVSLYIFSWGKNEYKNEFTEYRNIKVEDIPEPIIDVYKEVNRLS